MHKAVTLVVLLLVSMYFVPQIWYIFLAVLLGLFFLMVMAIITAFFAKTLGFAALEIWAARLILGKRRRKT